MKVLAFADVAEVIVGTLGALVAAATDFSLAPVTDDSFVRLTLARGRRIRFQVSGNLDHEVFL